MPILNGRRVSLAEWRAAKTPAEEPAAIEADDTEAAPAEKPKRQRRSSKKDVAAQVQAALGITPEATQDTEPEAGTKVLVEAEGQPEAAPAEAGEAATEDNA